MAMCVANPTEGDWDFDGQCKPYNSTCGVPGSTFSVGIFQWVRKKNGTGIKRGPVVKRIRGLVSEYGEVYRKANRYIDQIILEVKSGGRANSFGPRRCNPGRAG